MCQECGSIFLRPGVEDGRATGGADGDPPREVGQWNFTLSSPFFRPEKSAIDHGQVGLLLLTFLHTKVPLGHLLVFTPTSRVIEHEIVAFERRAVRVLRNGVGVRAGRGERRSAERPPRERIPELKREFTVANIDFPP